MFKTLRSYILWTHERGSLHYDVMVTILLLFIFLSPRWINFRDKPAERIPHQTTVIIRQDPGDPSATIYQIDARAVTQANTPEQVRASLLRVIEPISGEVAIDRYQEQRNARGQIEAYKVWVRR